MIVSHDMIRRLTPCSRGDFMNGRSRSCLKLFVVQGSRRLLCLPSSSLPWLTPTPLHVLEVRIHLPRTTSLLKWPGLCERRVSQSDSLPLSVCRLLVRSPYPLSGFARPLETLWPCSKVFSSRGRGANGRFPLTSFWCISRCRHTAILPRPTSGCFILHLEQVK